jgi:hypothetical protein
LGLLDGSFRETMPLGQYLLQPLVYDHPIGEPHDQQKKDRGNGRKQ